MILINSLNFSSPEVFKERHICKLTMLILNYMSHFDDKRNIYLQFLQDIQKNLKNQQVATEVFIY